MAVVPVIKDGVPLLLSGVPALAEDPCNCCTFESCDAFSDCFGISVGTTALDATVTFGGHVNGSCTDCSELNDTFIVNNLAYSQVGSNCVLVKTENFGASLCYSSFSVRVEISLSFGLGGAFQFLQVLWRGASVANQAVFTIQDDDDVLAAALALCNGETINVPWSSSSGGICDATGATCTLSIV